MQLFHGTQNNNIFSKQPLKHYGSSLAAAQRLGSMFDAQVRRIYNGGNTFTILDNNNVPIRNEPIEHALMAFCEFMDKYTIVEVDVDIKSPLRINDCWDDDPIGSGALDLFSSHKELTSSQLQQLTTLFHPFKHVIYPNDVYQNLSGTEIQKIYKSSKNNVFFRQELSQRKNRLIAIGTYTKKMMYHEAVWIDLTLKFRVWAIKNGFDSFVYQNSKEGKGDDCYITLLLNQARANTKRYVFNRDKYLDLVSPNLKNFFIKQIVKMGPETFPGQIKTENYLFWAGYDPLLFWI